MTELKLYQVGTFAAGNRLLDPPSAPSSRAPTAPTRSPRVTGPAAAAARRSGARVVLDAAMRATEGRIVTVNATGCLEVFSTPYPESAWQVPWLHSLFGNAAAVASGVAAALRAQGRDDVRVVAQAGDGGTVDIGIGCLSGMFERNDDVLFVCYDNQGYMNTGVQRSGATPPAASTATTRPSGTSVGNAFGTGKIMPVIAMAHEIPYVATATVADLHDLEAKVTTAMSLHGARYLHVLVPCPLGWGTDVRATPSASRGSPPSPGCSPSSRPSTATSPAYADPTAGARGGVPAAPDPVRPPVPGRRAARRRRPHCSARPTATSPTIVLLEEGEHDDEELPFAITLGPGSSLADHTGAWRTERPGLRRARRAVRQRLPGGRGRPVLAVRRRVRRGRLRGGLAPDHGRQPVPRRDGPGLLPPVRDGLQPRRPRRRGRHQLRRALPRRRRDPTGLDGRAVHGAPTGRRVLVVGAGPGGLSAAYHLACRARRHGPRRRPARPAG